MPLFLLVLTRIKLKYLDPPLELKIELFNIGWKVDIFLSFSLYMYNFVKNISTLVGTYDFFFIDMSSDSFRFNVIRSIEFPSIFIARVDEYTIIFLSFSISRLFSFQQFLRNVLRRITISMTFLLNSFLLPPFVCYLLRTICIILISENT